MNSVGSVRGFVKKPYLLARSLRSLELTETAKQNFNLKSLCVLCELCERYISQTLQVFRTLVNISPAHMAFRLSTGGMRPARHAG